MEIKKIFRLVMLAFVAGAMSACSSMNTVIIKPEEVTKNGIKTYHAHTKDFVDGLTYYMPKKDFVVTVTVKTGAKIVTSSTTEAYPDLSKQYVVKYKTNIFGDNKLIVGINKNGLLSSINSVTESKVNEIFKNLAKSAGYVTALAGETPDPKTTCSKDGTYIFMHRGPVEDWKICGEEITVKITKYETNEHIIPHTREENTEHSGIFYRQDIPYTVNVVGQDIVSNTIVFSPSESPTHYLPIAKSFFGNNEATFALADGIITSYKQDNKSELVALASIPADILEAYFSAITSAFTTTSAADTAESTALTNSLKLDLAKTKYNLCIAALNDKNNALAEQLECGQ